MKRIIVLAAICSIAAAAVADSALNLQPINRVGHATYNTATGQLTPTPYPVRYGNSVWDVTHWADHYIASMKYDLGLLDWGDIADGSVIGGFQFSYGTDLSTPIDCTIVFYSDYDGYNSNGFYGTFGFAFTDLPSVVGAYNAWVITADLEPNFTFPIMGNDIDGDGMADFGYSYWFSNLYGLGSATGPVIAWPDLSKFPNLAAAEAALGIEDAFGSYTPDPNDPNGLIYPATIWGQDLEPNAPGTLYLQLYLNLFEVSECGAPGASGMFCTADIDGSGDCTVGLADLATLLSSYGVNAGGDIEPPGGDGDTNLQDLAALLAQYGDDCNP